MLPSVVTKEKRPEAVAMRTACKIKTNKKKTFKGTVLLSYRCIAFKETIARF
jgi:hypothetical protein